MQVHQAAILLHFNTNDSATVAELEAFTQMEPETLIRTIRSLVQASILTSCSVSTLLLIWSYRYFTVTLYNYRDLLK